MKYKVIFHSQAILDIETSFNWGLRVWGKTQAKKWANQFYRTCKKRLSQFPESCPIALESKDLGATIRQLIIDRYRALFVIEGDTVEILYVAVLMLAQCSTIRTSQTNLVTSNLVRKPSVFNAARG